MKFKRFKEYILQIKALTELDDNIAYAVTKYNKSSSSGADFIYPSMIGSVIELLEEITGDTDKWIEYWVYELDFGNDYTVGCVKDHMGNCIKLQTEENLWSLIKGDPDYV